MVFFRNNITIAFYFIMFPFDTRLVTLPYVIPIRNITPIIEHITPKRYVLAGDADICATNSLTLSTGAIWKKTEQITDMYNNCMISI